MIKEIKLAKHITCELHKLDKVYFCVKCSEALCPDCYMDNHIGHKRKNLKQEYEERKQSLNNAANSIDQMVEEA